MVDKVIELFSSSVIVQGLISLMLVSALVYQEVTVHSVDTDLKLICIGVISFWLGGKAVLMAQFTRDRQKSNRTKGRYYDSTGT